MGTLCSALFCLAVFSVPAIGFPHLSSEHGERSRELLFSSLRSRSRFEPYCISVPHFVICNIVGLRGRSRSWRRSPRFKLNAWTSACRSLRPSVQPLDEKFDAELFSDFSAKILEGSFSAVSTPIFASKNSFCSVFQDLQDCHTFAPLETQNFRNF